MSIDSTPHATFHESNALLVLKIVLLQLLIALASVALTLAFFYFFSSVGETKLLITFIILTSIVLHTIDAGILATLILRWKNTSFSISSDQVVVRHDGPKKRTNIYNTRDIGAVEVDQSPLGRALDYGTVSFNAPGLESRVELPNIPHPWQQAELMSRGGSGSA